MAILSLVCLISLSQHTQILIGQVVLKQDALRQATAFILATTAYPGH